MAFAGIFCEYCGVVGGLSFMVEFRVFCSGVDRDRAKARARVAEERFSRRQEDRIVREASRSAGRVKPGRRGRPPSGDREYKRFVKCV